MLLLVLCYYFAVLGANAMGQEKANVWAVQYFSSFLIDMSFV